MFTPVTSCIIKFGYVAYFFKTSTSMTSSKLRAPNSLSKGPQAKLSLKFKIGVVSIMRVILFSVRRSLNISAYKVTILGTPVTLAASSVAASIVSVTFIATVESMLYESMYLKKSRYSSS